MLSYLVYILIHILPYLYQHHHRYFIFSLSSLLPYHHPYHTLSLSTSLYYLTIYHHRHFILLLPSSLCFFAFLSLSSVFFSKLLTVSSSPSSLSSLSYFIFIIIFIYLIIYSMTLTISLPCFSLHHYLTLSLYHHLYHHHFHYHIDFPNHLHPYRPLPSFFYVELLSNVWFTGEIMVRMCFCPNIVQFLKMPVNIIDMIATISFYIDWALDSYLTGSNRFVCFAHFLTKCCFSEIPSSSFP